MDGGLTTGDADTLQDPLALFQERQQRLHGHNRRNVRAQQLRVVAEGTAEVAASGKNRAGNPAGIVK